MSKEITDILNQFEENLHEDGVDPRNWAKARIEALIKSKLKEKDKEIKQLKSHIKDLIRGE